MTLPTETFCSQSGAQET